MFSAVNIEVSGKCNAKCTWCATGHLNRTKTPYPDGMMSLELFKQIILHLEQEKLIAPGQTLINLYNWGEPYLNPELEEILQYLNGKGHFYAISTNASVFRPFTSHNVFRNLNEFKISMPGFSQASYDRIHQLNFEQIKKNIVACVDNLKAGGFTQQPEIMWHVYQFNRAEMAPAQDFAQQLDIQFRPYYAYINDLRRNIDYCTGAMPAEEMVRASRELSLYYYDEVLPKRPENHSCYQLYNVLSVDERGNLLLCCAAGKLTEGVILGSVLDMDSSAIIQAKQPNALCRECQKCHMDYLVMTPQWDTLPIAARQVKERPPVIVDKNDEPLPAQADIVTPEENAEFLSTQPVSVAGWVLDGLGILAVDIVVDGVFMGTAAPVATENIYKAYPQYQNHHAGFVYIIPAGLVSKGKHQLQVVLQNYGGDIFGLSRDFIVT